MNGMGIAGYIFLGLSVATYVVALFIAASQPKKKREWGFPSAIAFVLMEIALELFWAETQTEGKLNAAYLLLGASVFAFFLGVCCLVSLKRLRLWCFAGFMFATVLLLQLAFQIAVYPNEEASLGKINPLAELFTGFLSNTFQMFSLDLNYSDFIAQGGSTFIGHGSIVFYVTAILMTAVAPATGGFAVFGILCHFFPYLLLVRHGFKRTKYVFSELNEYSIETAESLYKKIRQGRAAYKGDKEDWKWLKSSVIIFTDAYTNSAEESSSELLERAKNIGAVCLKNDITELNVFWLFRRCSHKRIVYFLMDKTEEENLKTAVTVLSADKEVNRWAKLGGPRTVLKASKMELFVFSKNRETNTLIKDKYEKFRNAYQKRLEEKSEKRKEKEALNVTFKTINEYRNLVYRLISGYASSEVSTFEESYPLYWNKLGEDEGSEVDLSSLSIVIVGGGRIGKEFFMAAYWCGQMFSPVFGEERLSYKPVALNIKVISKDAKETERQLRFEMPEAFEKMSDTEDAPAYCHARFIEAEFGKSADDRNDDFGEAFLECADADYVLVALGEDDLNLRAAHWIKRALDRRNIASPRQIPVNYVIENTELCRSVVPDSSHCTKGCIMHPFGSLSQRYHSDNIYLTEMERRALSIDRVHEGSKKTKSEFIMDEYNRNSSIASALHFPYKLVSCGALKTRKRIRDSRDVTFCTDVEFKKYYSNALYWLEHRRWNAYIRSIGYRAPTANEYLRYAFGGNHEYSLNDDKTCRGQYGLHPCLLESGEHYGTLSALARSWEHDCVKKNRDTRSAASLAADKLKELAPHGEEIGLGKLLNAVDFSCVFKSGKPLDALDRLTLITGIEFKDYDVGVVTNLYVDELRKDILAMLSSKDAQLLNEQASKLAGAYVGETDGNKDVCELGGLQLIRNGIWVKEGTQNYETVIVPFSGDGGNVIEMLQAYFDDGSRKFDEKEEQRVKLEAFRKNLKECVFVDPANLCFPRGNKMFAIGLPGEDSLTGGSVLLGIPCGTASVDFEFLRKISKKTAERKNEAV